MGDRASAAFGGAATLDPQPICSSSLEVDPLTCGAGAALPKTCDVPSLPIYFSARWTMPRHVLIQLYVGAAPVLDRVLLPNTASPPPHAGRGTVEKFEPGAVLGTRGGRPRDTFIHSSLGAHSQRASTTA